MSTEGISNTSFVNFPDLEDMEVGMNMDITKRREPYSDNVLWPSCTRREIFTIGTET